ncbi:OapA N-terminal domain-containing protein [Prevotella histicola]
MRLRSMRMKQLPKSHRIALCSFKS